MVALDDAVHGAQAKQLWRRVCRDGQVPHQLDDLVPHLILQAEKDEARTHTNTSTDHRHADSKGCSASMAAGCSTHAVSQCGSWRALTSSRTTTVWVIRAGCRSVLAQPQPLVSTRTTAHTPVCLRQTASPAVPAAALRPARCAPVGTRASQTACPAVRTGTGWPPQPAGQTCGT